MRSAVARVSRRSVRFLVAVLVAAGFGVAGVSAVAQTVTTITGVVHAPKSALITVPDVLPNILVFLQVPSSTLTDFSKLPVGVTGGCVTQGSLVDASTVLAYTSSDYAGAFSLTGSALSALPSGTYNLVLQAGKWRRVQSITLTAGSPNNVGAVYMPSSQAEGDLPHIAIVSGSADGIECTLRQMGIADSEFTTTAGSGRVNLFSGTYSSGAIISSSSGDTEAKLMTSNTTVTTTSGTSTVPLLNTYDLLMLGCQGAAVDSTVTSTTTGRNNLASYANNGGRVFGTHFAYIWLQDPLTFKAAANWTGTDTTPYSGAGIIDVDTSYTQGQILSKWLQVVNPSDPAGKITNVQNLRKNQSGVIAPTQSWGTLEGYGNPVMQFSFDTPVGGTTGISIGLAFTNTPTAFTRNDTADQIAVQVTNTSTQVGTGFLVALSLPNGFTASSLVASSPSNWNCQMSPLQCAYIGSSFNAGQTDTLTLTLSVSSTMNVGNASVNATVSGSAITTGSQCGRVLFNEYHVETTSTGTYPNECRTPNSVGAQKFIEYSLYNLSNFISPSNSDTVLVRGAATLSWTPKSPVYYGTPLSAMETATADTPGTFTYTYTPNNGNTPLDAGTYSFTANFTPTDTTDYLNASTTGTITVLQDPTAVSVTNINTAPYYGQEIGNDPTLGRGVLDVAVVAPGYTTSVNQGTYTATLDGTAVCNGSAGVTLSAGNGPNGCPDTGFLGLNAGSHSLSLAYAGTADFGSSVLATPVAVYIHPDPTATVVSTGNASVAVHTNVTFTASTSNAYTPAFGSIVFYDATAAVTAQVATDAAPSVVPFPAGATLIGTQPLVANGSATTSLTTLTVGTHYIVACFVGDVNSSSTYNFRDSCSASVAQVITLPPTAPLGTQTLLVTSVNPAALGQAVSFTATVKTTGALTQIPTGSVVFTVDGTAASTVTLAADGTAVFTTSSLTLGTHAIVATYGGSSTMATSVSASLSEVVETALAAAGTGFLLEVSPTTLPVAVGGSSVVTIQIVSLTDFNQAVGLTCTGLPAQSTCVFAQSTVPAGGGTTQLLVTASAPHNCNSTSPYFVAGNGWGWPLFGMSMLTLFAAKKRKKLQAVALVAMLMALPTVLSGCGGGNCTDFGVKPGDYSFTITATSKGSPSIVKSQAMTMHAHL